MPSNGNPVALVIDDQAIEGWSKAIYTLRFLRQGAEVDLAHVGTIASRIMRYANSMLAVHKYADTVEVQAAGMVQFIVSRDDVSSITNSERAFADPLAYGPCGSEG